MTFTPYIILIGTFIGISAVPSNLTREVEEFEEAPPGPPLERIINGDLAEEGEFPGQVSVQLAGIHMFGGSIITNEWVLTTARVSGNNTAGYMVLVGTNSLINGGTYHSVEKIFAHPDYNESDASANDISLIKLKEPIRLGVLARPVILPEDRLKIPEGTQGLVIGWGWTRNSSTVSIHLRKETITLIDHVKCEELYNKHGFSIHPTQMCAEDEQFQTGPCSGDAGGPFIVNGKVVGIISFSLGCAVEGYPNVLTDVSQYMDWIRDTIVTNSII